MLLVSTEENLESGLRDDHPRREDVVEGLSGRPRSGPELSRPRDPSRHGRKCVVAHILDGGA